MLRVPAAPTTTMRVLAVLSFAAALGVHAASVSTSTDPLVDVGYTRLRGTASVAPAAPGVYFFGGIRYAVPPLGSLRFRAPQPLNERSVSANSRNTTDARSFGDICIQQPAAINFGSEGAF
jgi:hypothetical protein